MPDGPCSAINADVNSKPALLRSPAAPRADLGKDVAASTLGDVLDRVSDGVVALDREWHYTYVNPQAAHIFGREPQELIGRHSSEKLDVQNDIELADYVRAHGVN